MPSTDFYSHDFDVVCQQFSPRQPFYAVPFCRPLGLNFHGDFAREPSHKEPGCRVSNAPLEFVSVLARTFSHSMTAPHRRMLRHLDKSNVNLTWNRPWAQRCFCTKFCPQLSQACFSHPSALSAYVPCFAIGLGSVPHTVFPHARPALCSHSLLRTYASETCSDTWWMLPTHDREHMFRHAFLMVFDHNFNRGRLLRLHSAGRLL